MPPSYCIHIGSAASGMYSREVVGWSERHACARSAGPRARRHGTGAVPHRPTWRCAHGPGAATGAARRSTQTLLSFCYHAAPLPHPALGDHPGGSVFGLTVTPRSRRPPWWLRPAFGYAASGGAAAAGRRALRAGAGGRGVRYRGMCAPRTGGVGGVRARRAGGQLSLGTCEASSAAAFGADPALAPAQTPAPIVGLRLHNLRCMQTRDRSATPWGRGANPEIRARCQGVPRRPPFCLRSPQPCAPPGSARRPL